MAHHAGLSAERWQTFSLDRQLLMIANEMHRASKLDSPGDGARRQSAYARVLQLVDLTVEAPHRAAVRREMLRWRDLVAMLYVAPAADATAHAAAFRALLRLTPGTARQIPFVLADPPLPSDGADREPRRLHSS